MFEIFLCSDQLMASQNRHRKTGYWYSTVVTRLINLGAVNTRGMAKKFTEYKMSDIKRLLAFALAKRATRDELVSSDDDESLSETDEEEEMGIGMRRRKQKEGTHRLDNNFHWMTTGKKRRTCRVHNLREDRVTPGPARCLRKTKCAVCRVHLCQDGFYVYHTQKRI